MTFYTVKPGDTIYKIARTQSISPVKLMEDNGTQNPDALTVGDCLICNDATQIHIVNGGESLTRIADRFGVSCGTLLRNNPSLLGKTGLYPGQNLSIRLQRPQNGEIVTTVFIDASESEEAVTPLLPYLTNLCIRFGKIKNGRLETPKSAPSFIRLCRDYGVHTLLEIDGDFSVDQEELHAFCDLGFCGIVLSSPCQDLRPLLRERGLSLYYRGELLPQNDVDATFLDPALPLSQIQAEETIQKALQIAEADKVFPIISSYASDRCLDSTGEKRIPLADFAPLAEKKNSAITYDAENGAQFGYRHHHGSQSNDHVVCGENAKSIAAKAKLLSENGFRGICIDGALPFYAPLWMTVHSLFHIVKGNFGALR